MPPLEKTRKAKLCEAENLGGDWPRIKGLRWSQANGMKLESKPVHQHPANSNTPGNRKLPKPLIPTSCFKPHAQQL